jgi:malonate-semialdehyde dehydrogenase (acetylating)/methylmalonate-semialdehyde dehydrogenase
MVEEVKLLVPGESLGTVISAEAKDRIENYITKAERNGAKILIDGRKISVKGKEGGFYVGATILDFVTPDMAAAQDEIFGPVLSIIRAKNIDEAIAIENNSSYGNAAAVFTQNGSMPKLVFNFKLGIME